MADFARLRVTLTGNPVTGPSVATFYNSAPGSVGFADAVEAFYTSVVGQFPFNLQFTVPSNGDILESTTGDLIGAWSDPGTGGVVSTSGAANWTQGVGARVVWNTNGLFNGRRVRGSTFMVPLWSGAYEGAGMLVAGTISTFQSAANALIAAWPDLCVYSRNTNGTNGEVNVVTSASVPDAVSWLRTRRT